MLAFFFFEDTATAEIYTLSLHDALPISQVIDVDQAHLAEPFLKPAMERCPALSPGRGDRKSTRLNSSHMSISYAVFCLKKNTKRDYWQSVRDFTPSYDRPGIYTQLEPCF